MHLISRSMRVSDISPLACLPLREESACYSAERPPLAQLWQKILTQDYTETLVIEDWDHAEATRIPGGTCGLEKRRWLLAYLLDHPEELHPYRR